MAGVTANTLRERGAANTRTRTTPALISGGVFVRYETFSGVRPSVRPANAFAKVFASVRIGVRPNRATLP